MLPRIAVVAALLAGLACASASPAIAQDEAPARVLVLWVDGTTLADWTGEDLPAFRALLDEGAVGVMTAASGYAGADPVAAGLAAAQTVGAGRIIPGAPTDDQRRSPVALALGTFDITTTLLSGAPEPLPRTAERTFGPLGVVGGGRFARRDRAFPGGSRTDADAMIRALDADEGQARLLLAHVPDALLVESEVGPGSARDGWVALTMRRADRILAALRARASERDLVLIVSPTPPSTRRGDAPPLTAIALSRPSITTGLLRSATTGRDGLVSLSDVGPTILAGLGVAPSDVERIVLPRFLDAPLPFAGHPLDAVQRSGAVEAARALERDLLDAASAHRTSARGWLLATMIVVLLGATTIVAGRGRPVGSGRMPRSWRDALATICLIVVAFPASSLLAGGSVRTAWIIAALGGVGIRALIGRERGAATIVVLTMFLVVGDALAGGPLSSRAALRMPVAFGRHLLPTDPVAIGVALAALPAAGGLLDRARIDDRWTWLLLATGGLVVFVTGADGLSGDGGAAAAVLPALLLLATASWGVRRDVFTGTAIVGLTIAGLGLLALTYGPAIWVEEAPLLPQRGIPSGIAGRWDAFVDVLPTIWTVGLIVTAGVIAALRLRRPMLTDRGWWGRAHLRAGASAAAMGATIALVTVRAGIVTAATVAAIGAILLLVPLLAPDDG